MCKCMIGACREVLSNVLTVAQDLVLGSSFANVLRMEDAFEHGTKAFSVSEATDMQANVTLALSL